MLRALTLKLLLSVMPGNTMFYILLIATMLQTCISVMRPSKERVLFQAVDEMVPAGSYDGNRGSFSRALRKTGRVAEEQVLPISAVLAGSLLRVIACGS